MKSTARDVVDAVDIDQETIDSLLERAKLGIDDLRYGKTPGQTKRIRLLLALANFEVNNLHPIHHLTIKELLKTSRKLRGQMHHGYDIEHISAASKSDDLGEARDSIGNLTLFYSKDNRSVGNADVELKAESYANSILYLTKSLTLTPQQDKAIEKVVKEHRSSTVDDGLWGEQKIEDRAQQYFSIFEQSIRSNLTPTS